VAGDAMHWFDLESVVPRVAAVLRPGAVLALTRRTAGLPGLDAIGEVIVRYSRAPEHDASYEVAADLSGRGFCGGSLGRQSARQSRFVSHRAIICSTCARPPRWLES
jgi:hypothetical protein